MHVKVGEALLSASSSVNVKQMSRACWKSGSAPGLGYSYGQVSIPASRELRVRGWSGCLKKKFSHVGAKRGMY